MRLNGVRTYVTIGITLGVVLAVPLWQAALAGQKMPQNWPEAKPQLLALTLASGHGVLRMYSWLPSLIYHVGFHGVAFKDWVFTGW